MDSRLRGNDRERGGNDEGSWSRFGSLCDGLASHFRVVFNGLLDHNRPFTE